MIRIFGAGVMGLVTAQVFSLQGHAVELVDPAPAPGPQACSWWAGGMLAPYCEAASTDALVGRAGLDGLAWWQALGAGVQSQGTLVLALGRDQNELATFAKRSCGHQPLDRSGIAALEPDLGGHFSRGLFYAAEAHLDPRLALHALQAQLAAAGVAWHHSAPRGAAALEIDARGLAARDDLPDLRGVRGEMLLLSAPQISLSRPVRLLHPKYPLYVVPRGAGQVMLGATMVESDQRGPITARGAMELLSAAYALHPGFAEASVLEMGADARPAFPDNLPALRWRKGRMYLNGLYRHGFLLSPVLAQMALAQWQSGRLGEDQTLRNWVQKEMSCC